ncbi:endonuclease/exonuclease/phosphatase family protein [Anaerosporobacter faecicola]|uniref:endonuclease/exonuclease/phosphatase family protein n=1 Tax=Anaerosporobacter faecicola TaxID=2718714 RepID=UPI00143B211A|nr:endonuclease/exonuclease/phosphatase family protein [Anaerosporobacter faecicola]
MNLNGNKDDILSNEKDNLKCDIYAYQESKYALPEKTRINTVIIGADNIIHKNVNNFKDIWNEYFPWLTFPENYFSEYDYIDVNSKIIFKLINVHLAGFWSEKRHLLEFVLLQRLQQEELQNLNVILVGDFNAQKKYSGKKTSGTLFLEKLENLGFDEKFSTSEENNNLVVPTYYNHEDGVRLDHIYIRCSHDFYNNVEVNYYPAYSDNEMSIECASDHRGIILELN